MDCPVGFTKDDRVTLSAARLQSIGVTGGIASGKSTFARILGRRCGWVVFDSDAEARDLLANDLEVRSLVETRVDAAAYRPDGTPDRARIRGIVFRNTALKGELEGILHPRVAARWAGLVESSDVPVIVDSPLLFETGAARKLDAVVVVACSRDVQVRRVVSRGLDEGGACRIIDSQMPTLDKVAMADHVVWNDGAESLLEDQCTELLAVLPRAGKKSASVD